MAEPWPDGTSSSALRSRPNPIRLTTDGAANRRTCSDVCRLPAAAAVLRRGASCSSIGVNRNSPNTPRNAMPLQPPARPAAGVRSSPIENSASVTLGNADRRYPRSRWAAPFGAVIGITIRPSVGPGPRAETGAWGFDGSEISCSDETAPWSGYRSAWRWVWRGERVADAMVDGHPGVAVDGKPPSRSGAGTAADASATSFVADRLRRQLQQLVAAAGGGSQQLLEGRIDLRCPLPRPGRPWRQPPQAGPGSRSVAGMKLPGPNLAAACAGSRLRAFALGRRRRPAGRPGYSLTRTSAELAGMRYFKGLPGSSQRSRPDLRPARCARRGPVRRPDRCPLVTRAVHRLDVAPPRDQRPATLLLALGRYLDGGRRYRARPRGAATLSGWRTSMKRRAETRAAKGNPAQTMRGRDTSVFAFGGANACCEGVASPSASGPQQGRCRGPDERRAKRLGRLGDAEGQSACGLLLAGPTAWI